MRRFSSLSHRMCAPWWGLSLLALAVTGAGLFACRGPAAGETPSLRDRPRVSHDTPRFTSERPGGVGDDPFQSARDVTGRSVKTPRVRAVHQRGGKEPGTTGWLLAHDPWLAYARGRELTLREFAAKDGVFGESGRLAGGTLDDGVTKMMSRDHTNSCALCHNVPFGDAGAGATIAKNGGLGRNTPHLFGAGLIEILGWQTRLRLLELGDVDRNGWISRDEAKGRRALLHEGPYSLDYGSFDDADADGRPDLNPVLYVWYVDARGQRISWGRSLDDEGVAGYCFEVQVFGHGQRDRQSHGGISSTLRAFTANAFDVHSGLIPCDPTCNVEPNARGLAGVSLLGAPQFYTARTRDRAQAKDAAGRSLDDPDRDGVLEEITEGDLDLVECYLLNHPRPARKSEVGRSIFETTGCTRCHVPEWRIEPARESEDYTARRTGDRRFFDLDVTFVDGEPRGGVRRITPGAATLVTDVYSDFLHHDLGPDFEEIQFDGSRVKFHRTPPLWGVGSTAPYGHDGQSLDLDAVIRRHGGEASRERDAYVALPEAARGELLGFLRGLVLYSTDRIRCDVDGNGTLDEHFFVQGVDTLHERLNPEWLFRIPARIEGATTNVHGEPIHSLAVQNLTEAWGLDLEWLEDQNADGWPDRQVPLLEGKK